MIANILENVSNARNYGGVKETTSTMQVIARNKQGALSSIVEARFYMGRSTNSSIVYCSLWVHCGDVYTTGTGKAGGGGYHKESAALGAAIRDANIKLFGSPYSNPEGGEDLEKPAFIAGCGSDSMRKALVAIAEATGADCTEYLVL
jgi:hypothetical protein